MILTTEQFDQLMQALHDAGWPSSRFKQRPLAVVQKFDHSTCHEDYNCDDGEWEVLFLFDGQAVYFPTHAQALDFALRVVEQ